MSISIVMNVAHDRGWKTLEEQPSEFGKKTFPLVHVN